jgi:hypothetical protein
MTINPLPATDRLFFIITPVVRIQISWSDIGNIVDLPEDYAWSRLNLLMEYRGIERFVTSLQQR